MSNERSDTGKTRLPRSTLSGTPSDSKKAIVSRPSQREKALYKNRPLCGTWAKSSSQALSFVTLQRPFPVIFSFFPSRSFGSSSVTATPLRAAQIAAIIPEAPPPITNSSLFIFDLAENAEAIPHMLQFGEGGGHIRIFLACGCKDQRVEHAHRRGKRVHKGDHLVVHDQ